MCKVTIDGKIQYAADGTLLSDLLIESGADAEHLCGGRGTCRKCVVIVDGKKELACQYVIKEDITVELSEKGEIVSGTGATESGEVTENVCFCLDIGTTTLALALVSLDNSKIIKVITRKNPQRVFGADVMTRIDCCRKNGVRALQKAVISEINSMIAGFNLKKSEKLYVAGNATMLHIFFGVDCTAMGVAPYSPVFLDGKTENAENLGIEGAETVESLPSVAAFVGADVVAGLNFIGMPENGRHNLLIDLGTNAEIVLYDSNSALCTSAAAGPCFEGANISCGMSATDGAIYSYSASQTKTVGRMPAKGICGTGLVDIIAELLRNKTIDETGFMECEEFEIAGLAGKVWQYFTAVPEFRSVGVKDGKRTYAYPVIVRAVNTVDAMTATIEEIPYEVLKKITDRITTEVENVNRVLYDLTPKPCGTIEWE